jgi:hypothetical protein
MSCYAATKHQVISEKDSKVARIQSKDKKSTIFNNFAEAEMIDKYNGKLMNAIWGIYNRNSPHNFKSLQNPDSAAMVQKEQGMQKSEKITSFVQFTVPQFNGIVTAGLETKIEVNKPKTSLEKLESLFYTF